VSVDTPKEPIQAALRATGIASALSTATNFGGVWSRAPAGSESGWGINCAVPFDPAKVRCEPVGTLTRSFADGNHVSFDYTVTPGNPSTTVSHSKQPTHRVFSPPGTVFR
jgi:hypothetical protein